MQLAIEGQHLEAIEYLLEAGVDPNIGDDDQVYVKHRHLRECS
jgi:hypothetical protein